MLAADELARTLPQFIGTQAYHRLSPLHGPLVVTDGVAWLCQNAGCFWLLDAIASYQRGILQRGHSKKATNTDRMLLNWQFWKLTVEDNKGVLVCLPDQGKPAAIRQEIDYTDFPLPEVSIWVSATSVGGKGDLLLVAMLPNEH